MAHSTIAPFKKALVARLRQRGGLTGVQVAYRPPAEPAFETLFLGRTVGQHSIDLERAGRKKREEEYTVDVWVSVLAADENDADDRAAEIAGELEDLLADDPKLAGAVPGLLWAVIAKYELNTFENPDAGAEAVVELGVAVRARLD